MNTPTPATSRPDFQLPRSHAAFQDACRVIPGGVNSPARAFGAVGGEPPFMARAEGPFLLRYRRPPLHRLHRLVGPHDPGTPPPPGEVGHRADAFDDGTSFGAPTEREAKIAEAVADAVPSIEMVRFVSSGTEAAMSAVRLAAASPGASKIVKMTGHYHGHVDALLVQAGSAATTLGHPNSPGVTPGAVADTLLCPFNDARSRRSISHRQHPGQIAAVLLEPVAGNMGLVPPRARISAKASASSPAKHGSLLVFDEVMTGFRLALGGAQTALRRHARPHRPGQDRRRRPAGGRLWRLPADHGTRLARRPHLPGRHPLRQPAGHGRRPGHAQPSFATTRPMTSSKPCPPAWPKVWRKACRDAGVPHSVQRVGSMLTLFFHDGPVTDYETAKQSDTTLFGRFFWEMLARGVYLPCSQFEAAFVSAAHTPDLVEETIAAARESLRSITS